MAGTGQLKCSGLTRNLTKAFFLERESHKTMRSRVVEKVHRMLDRDLDDARSSPPAYVELVEHINCDLEAVGRHMEDLSLVYAQRLRVSFAGTTLGYGSTNAVSPFGVCGHVHMACCVILSSVVPALAVVEATQVKRENKT
jgi:hypothetical protein